MRTRLYYTWLLCFYMVYRMDNCNSSDTRCDKRKVVERKVIIKTDNNYQLVNTYRLFY